MAKIRCKEYECKHNYQEQCMIKKVYINDAAGCDSFDVKHDGSPIDIEFGLEENFFENVKDNEISCRSKSCRSNNEGDCLRKHLTVDSLNNMAKCEDYQKR